MARDVKFDQDGFNRSLANSTFMKQVAYQLANEQFQEAKQELINEFEDSPVTREIEAGPGADNISGTLGGEGDLYSFIGFPEGTNPLTPIRDAIDKARLKKTSPRVYPRKDGIEYSFDILDSQVRNLEKKTPLPFERGQSWLIGIEQGISNFGHYLRGLFNGSRSGGGIQVEGTVRTISFKSVSYFTDMYNRFLKSFKN